ncbi:hypothetical protein [Cellulosimicrobium sp. SH8]|uniref:hypothetical protein n=1 Tax=Cellulosimicrobium sp. SH8 TaxID=2952936 RepID=UPI0021F2FCC3|nr:hypothetical protein [Cellulosimicrobium sp. SH8]
MSDVATALLDLGGFFFCLWFAVAALFGYAVGRMTRRRDEQQPTDTAPTTHPALLDRGPLVFIAAPTQQAAHHWRASQTLNPSHVRLCTTPSTARGLRFIDGDRLVILDGTPADVRLALAHVRNRQYDIDVTVQVPEVGYRSR